MPKHNTEKDFWERVDSSKGEDECWEWQGGRSSRGYGKLSYDGKDVRAHRLVYKLIYGTSPDAVCHKCDNPPCCNPKHLFAGTNGSNNSDRKRKGRSNNLKGEEHFHAKLTSNQVLYIREAHNNGVSQAELGRKFGLQRSSIGQIVRGERWKHLLRDNS